MPRLANYATEKVEGDTYVLNLGQFGFEAIGKSWKVFEREVVR